MDDRLEKLLEKAKALPKAPGVYLMKDDKGRVDLHRQVGVACATASAATSSRRPSSSTRSPGCSTCVVDFEVIQTDSEVEALLAENRLIKDIQPTLQRPAARRQDVSRT